MEAPHRGRWVQASGPRAEERHPPMPWHWDQAGRRDPWPLRSTPEGPGQSLALLGVACLGQLPPGRTVALRPSRSGPGSTPRPPAVAPVCPQGQDSEAAEPLVLEAQLCHPSQFTEAAAYSSAAPLASRGPHAPSLTPSEAKSGCPTHHTRPGHTVPSGGCCIVRWSEGWPAGKQMTPSSTDAPAAALTSLYPQAKEQVTP